ncbi:MAG: ABC transporter permease [Rubricoccaceae bacterium]
MLKTTVLVALRRLQRERGITAINVLGLALGIACCLLLGAYVLDELRYDQFHPASGQTARIVLGEGEDATAMLHASLGPAIVQDVPGVERAVRIFKHWEAPLLATDDAAAIEENVYFADPTFFEVFGFELVSGEPATALDAPASIVLTESKARAYFGDADPVGQTLRYNTASSFTVTGVMSDAPVASHLQPEFVTTLSSLPQVAYAGIVDEWSVFYTYLALAEGVEASGVGAAITEVIAGFAPEEAEAPQVLLQPVTDIHLHSDLSSEIEATGDIRYVYLLTTLGLLILLIACINYVNLATARSLTRAREVGVRKAIGAVRSQIVRQFYAESLLIAVIALVVALVTFAAFAPAAEALTGRPLRLDASAGGLVLASIALVLVVVVGVGSYPAFFLSQFKPAVVLRGGTKAGSRGSGFRKPLVAVQFVASLLLLVGTAVVVQQLGYIQDARLGFDQDHVIAIPVQDRAVGESYAVLRDQWAQDASVRAIGTTSSSYPGRAHSEGHVIQRPEASEEEAIAIQRNWVDGAYLETLGVELVAGRGFATELWRDSASVILNEAATRALGWSDPASSIDRQVLLNGEELTVAGVTADYHYASLHDAIAPLVHTPNPWPTNVLVRVDAAGIAPTLDRLGASWSEFSEQPFTYHFLDEELGALYQQDVRWARLLTVASLLAVFVACLGLFGLAAFTAEQRKKEVSVRKVLGASVAHLVGLLTRDIAGLVGLASVVAVPLAYLAMSRWREGFAYRVELGPMPFLLAIGALAVIALLTVSVHALRAATADPINALRSE